MGNTESVVSSLAVQSNSGALIQKKSSVHSMTSQSTKPTSYNIHQNYMPQVTSENNTIVGAADAVSLQTHSTVNINGSALGREKVGLRSTLVRNNAPPSHQMSVSSGQADV